GTTTSLAGRLGTSRMTLIAARGHTVLDANSVAVSKARAGLSRVAATQLKRKLRLKRAPSTASFGTFSVSASAPAAPAPPAPAPAATPTPSPPATCTTFDATPAGSTD